MNPQAEDVGDGLRSLPERIAVVINLGGSETPITIKIRVAEPRVVDRHKILHNRHGGKRSRLNYITYRTYVAALVVVIRENRNNGGVIAVRVAVLGNKGGPPWTNRLIVVGGVKVRVRGKERGSSGVVRVGVRGGGVS